MKMKILSIILSMCLLTNAVPVYATANNETPTPVINTQDISTATQVEQPTTTSDIEKNNTEVDPTINTDLKDDIIVDPTTNTDIEDDTKVEPTEKDDDLKDDIKVEPTEKDDNPKDVTDKDVQLEELNKDVIEEDVDTEEIVSDEYEEYEPKVDPSQWSTFTEAGPLLPPMTLPTVYTMSRAMASRATEPPTTELMDVSDNPSGIILNKTVSEIPNDEGEYTITLETFTTGTVRKEETVIPTDIIVVMDQSTSMNIKDFSGAVDRQAALKNAVTNFIENVETEAKEHDVDHRIALVKFPDRPLGKANEPTFQDGATTLCGYLSLNNVNNVKNLKDKINNLPIGSELPIKSYTGTDVGMEEALKILENDDKKSTTEKPRNKVVILFTDGVPASPRNDDYSNISGYQNYGTQFYRFSEVIAKRAIEFSYKIKNDYGATVYSIGIMKDADNSIITGAGNKITTVGTTWEVEDLPNQTAIVNRFLNFLSSNSKEAKDLGAKPIDKENDGGQQISKWKITAEYQWENKGYYLTAHNADDLNNIFQSISSAVATPSVSLSEETEIRDYMTPYFTLPDDFNSNNVNIYTADCKSRSTDSDGNIAYQWEEKVEVKSGISVTVDKTNPDKAGIVVTGYNFDENFVSTTDKDSETSGNQYGQKLIIQFNVKPTDGFLGGNDVPTNTEDSGIYAPKLDADGKPIEDEFDEVAAYPVPDTNVQVQYKIDAIDQTVYLGNGAYLYDMFKLDKDLFDTKLNKFVDIVFEIYPKGTVTCDNNGNITNQSSLKDEDRLASFTINRGETLQQAINNTNKNKDFVIPAECTEYDLVCFATPNDPDDKKQAYVATQLSQAELGTYVHVLQPQVNGTDIWVDYDATVNLLEDGTSPTTWKDIKTGAEHTNIGEDDVTTPNKPSTVYYIYKDLHTGKCYKSPYQVDWNDDNDFEDTADGIPETETASTSEVSQTTLDGNTITYTVKDLNINIQNEKQYEIVGMQTLSSDGRKLIKYWSCDSNKHDEDTTDNDINIHLNKYNVDIKKTVKVTESDWKYNPQSFIFEVSQTVGGEKNITEVVMESGDFTQRAENKDGTYNYVYTKTVSNLYAGLDTTVTEDSNWSWRYVIQNARATNDKESGSITSEEINNNSIKVKYSHVTEIKDADTLVDTTEDNVLDDNDATVEDGNYNTNSNIKCYVNSNNDVVFIGQGNQPAVGEVDTAFVNIFQSNKWLSDEAVIANKFTGLTVSEGGGNE